MSSQMQQKRTFKILLAGLVVMLTVLPFVTTFNSLLTEIINGLGFYKLLQSTLVPWESRMVVILLKTIRISAYVAPAGDTNSFYILKNSQYSPVLMQWNCLGWQSFLLLILSMLVGLEGKYRLTSRLECILVGILGTFLSNIFRMAFITAGLYYVNSAFALLIHDYFAAFTTILWLVFYWWFSYRYILEENQT